MCTKTSVGVIGKKIDHIKILCRSIFVDTTLVEHGGVEKKSKN